MKRNILLCVGLIFVIFVAFQAAYSASNKEEFSRENYIAVSTIRQFVALNDKAIGEGNTYHVLFYSKTAEIALDKSEDQFNLIERYYAKKSHEALRIDVDNRVKAAEKALNAILPDMYKKVEEIEKDKLQGLSGNKRKFSILVKTIAHIGRDYANYMNSKEYIDAYCTYRMLQKIILEAEKLSRDPEVLPEDRAYLADGMEDVKKGSDEFFLNYMYAMIKVQVDLEYRMRGMK